MNHLKMKTIWDCVYQEIFEEKLFTKKQLLF